MAQIEELHKLYEEQNTPTKFNPIVITGGKEGPPENWLVDLPQWTVFLMAPKATLKLNEQQKDQLRRMPEVAELQIAFHAPGGHTWLLPECKRPKEGEPKYWVNTLNFSRMYDLKEVLFDPRVHTTGQSEQLVSDEDIQRSEGLLPSEDNS